MTKTKKNLVASKRTSHEHDELQLSTKATGKIKTASSSKYPKYNEKVYYYKLEWENRLVKKYNKALYAYKPKWEPGKYYKLEWENRLVKKYNKAAYKYRPEWKPGVDEKYEDAGKVKDEYEYVVEKR